MGTPVQIPSFGGTGGQGTVGSIATDYPLAPNIDVVDVASADQAIAADGTIETVGYSVAVVKPAAAVTGVILQAPANPKASCRLQVLNVSASADSVTFAASDSNVAGGSSISVAGNASSAFLWSVDLQLWVKAS